VRYLDAYREAGPVRDAVSDIREALADRTLTLMEVCGTHTVSLFRSGLRRIFPGQLRLLSGPGCPVCVTPNAYLDRAAALCRRPGTIVATFGDMFRVPGSSSSLEKEKAAGGDIRMVYSAIEAVRIAREEPGKTVVLLGVGFETTAPSVAASVLAAAQEGLSNFFVLGGHKTVPAALRALVADRSSKLDGFLLPGHVCTITGTGPFRFLAEELGMPGVVAGFEPLDIARAVRALARQAAGGAARVEVQYDRSVRPEGNPRALELLDRVFEPCDSVWRGIGTIAGSGLALRREFAGMDAWTRLPVEVEEEKTHPGCICGSILKGVKAPPECGLFGKQCTPRTPVGACMVSSEGTCAAYHKYGGHGG